MIKIKRRFAEITEEKARRTCRKMVKISEENEALRSLRVPKFRARIDMSSS